MGSHRGCAVVAKEYAGNFSPLRENPVLFKTLKRKKIRRKKILKNRSRINTRSVYYGFLTHKKAIPMARPIPATGPIQDFTPTKLPPEITSRLLGIDDVVVIWCTAEVVAAGLCAGAALCYSTISGKPVPMRCPTLGGGTSICGQIIIQGVLNKFCLPILQSLADMLTLINKWFSEASGQLYDEWEKMGQRCRDLYPELSGSAFDECVRASVEWLREQLAALLKEVEALRLQARRLWGGGGGGDRGGPLPIGVSRQ